MLANIVYLSLLLIASPVALYRAIRHGRYRRGWREKLLGQIHCAARRPGTARPPRVWLHAVSVGEVNLLKGIVARLEARYPGVQLIISSSTDTGFDLAVQRFGGDRVTFAPLDFSWAVRRALRRAEADLLVLVELEIWPNWVRAASRMGTPVAVINGRLSERSHRGYRRFRSVFASTFGRLAIVGCQDPQTRQRFVDLGVDPQRAIVTGSIKYDDAPRTRDSFDIDECIFTAGIQPWHRVWLAGSTQAGEEATVLRIYQQLAPRFPELRLILVPRHRERFAEVAEQIEQHGFTCRRRSEVATQSPRLSRETGPSSSPSPPLSAARHGRRDVEKSLSARPLAVQTEPRGWRSDEVFLVDTIGELAHWWGTAHIAFVGGSFGKRGGQNMLEPAGYGAAVSFGPSTRNFRDIVACLKAADGAVEVADQQALHEFVEMCLIDPPRADALGRSAQAAIAEHRGATERTLAALAPLLRGVESQQRAA